MLALTRENSRMATSELPPRSKKLSCLPTDRSSPSKVCQIAASATSVAVAGASDSLAAAAVMGAGSAA